MKWQSLSVLSAALCTVNAVFKDDAFHIDYHRALLGTALPHTTFFHKPRLTSNASLLYTISDKGVLGAINPKDGSLLWRQFLATKAASTPDSYLVAGDDGNVFSGSGSTAAAWDGMDGRLIWEYSFSEGVEVKGVVPVPLLSTTSDNLVQDVIVLAGPGKSGHAARVSRVGGGSQAKVWEYQDSSVSSDTHISIAADAKSVYYVTKSSGVLSGGKANVVVLDILTGKQNTQYSVGVDSEALGGADSLTIDLPEVPSLVSAEAPFKNVKINVLGNSKVSTLKLEEKGEEIEQVRVHYARNPRSPPHFLVHAKTATKHWAEVFHINLKSKDVTRAYSLPATSENSVFSAVSDGATTYFARVTDTEIILYSSESHGQLGRWSKTALRNQEVLPAIHAALEVSARGKTNLAIRASITSSDGDMTLVRNGEVQWTRPEKLAYIVKAVWSEDVVTTALAHEIENEAASNPISAYLHRLSRHVQDLSSLPSYLSNLPASVVHHNDDAAVSVRQKLMGGKLILAATSRLELLAIDAANSGVVRWRQDLAKELPSTDKVVHLSVNEDQLTVYMASGSYLILNIKDGHIIQNKKHSVSFDKLIELPGVPNAALVAVPSKGQPQLLAGISSSSPVEGNTVVTIDEDGIASGWTIGHSVEKLWTVHPPSNAKIVDIFSRPAQDAVASIGKVLGDRSVLYKYVTPNVALLTAMSTTTLTVYLINAVTGAMLHTASHDGVIIGAPISAVVSENWFAYSYSSHNPESAGLSTQLIISELYESMASNDRGPLSSQQNYSSFAPDANAKPHVITQAYSVAEPLSDFAVSQTLQGITSRQLLAYLPDSQAVIGIPREVLNARRPVDRDPNSDEVEEGLFKYSPILELDPKFFLNHLQEVAGIKHIMAAPTMLESTSVIFAYGHDIFGTQLAPSNTFDVLGKGFNRVQLVLTCVALYLGVIALRPLVRSKTVDLRWK